MWLVMNMFTCNKWLIFWLKTTYPQEKLVKYSQPTIKLITCRTESNVVINNMADFPSIFPNQIFATSQIIDLFKTQ